MGADSLLYQLAVREPARLSRHHHGGPAGSPGRLCRRPDGLGQGAAGLERALQISWRRGAAAGQAAREWGELGGAALLPLHLLQVRNSFPGTLHAVEGVSV